MGVLLRPHWPQDVVDPDDVAFVGGFVVNGDSGSGLDPQVAPPLLEPTVVAGHHLTFPQHWEERGGGGKNGRITEETKGGEEKEASYWFGSSWWRQQRALITTGRNEISTSPPWFISPLQVQMLCRLKGAGMIIVHYICIWLWLTVLMALPEVFQVFYVDEVVTGMTYDLCWGQIHILWDPAKKCNTFDY